MILCHCTLADRYLMTYVAASTLILDSNPLIIHVYESLVELKNLLFLFRSHLFTCCAGCRHVFGFCDIDCGCRYTLLTFILYIDHVPAHSQILRRQVFY